MKTKRAEKTEPPGCDAAWSRRMRRVVAELKKGAEKYSDEEIEAIVNEAVEAVRAENAARHPEGKGIMNLKGILRGYDIDLSDLEEFKKETWKHVDEEFAGDQTDSSAGKSGTKPPIRGVESERRSRD